MKRLIKRIISTSLAAALFMSSATIPAKAEPIASDPVSSTAELAKENMNGSDQDGTFMLNGITGINTNGNFEINVPEGSTKLLITKEFFKTADGANIVLGENVEIEKPDEGGVISGIDFANNNKIVGSLPFSSTFKGFTKLTTVKNLGLAINAVASSGTTYLTSTFEGCTALESINIDLTSQVGDVSFTNTFKGCTELSNVTINNANINKFTYLFGTDKESVPTDEVSVVINSSKLNDEYPVNNIAAYFNGSISIKNSTDKDGNGIDIGNLASYNDDTNTGKISFDFTGSKINSVKKLVDGTWDSFTANNIFSKETKEISSIFSSTTELSKAPTITGVMPTALDVIEHPFKGLDLPNDADEKSAVSSFLKGLDLTTCSKYRALYETTSNLDYTNEYNYTDLSELDLSASEDAVYEDFSNSSYLPEYFTTAKSFGGSYILPFEAWKYNEGEGEDVNLYERVLPDESGVTIKVDSITNMKGFKYNSGKLEAATKYTSARATIKITDVATGSYYTGYYGNDTNVTGTRQYQEGTEYFEDEALKIPYDAEGKKLVAGEVLTLYYTSDPDYNGSVDLTQKDITLNVVWEDTDATARPETIKVEWKAETETGESTTGSVNITSNKIVSTQTETITIPTTVEDKDVTLYTITADVTGTGYGYETVVEDEPDTIKLVLKKGTSTTTPPPAEEEPDYSVISDMPTDWTANFVGDVTEITATLEDGSTRKLGQDGDVIKFSAKDMSANPDAYAKVEELAGYSNHDFYTFNITILNGNNEYKVKSIDGLYEFIYCNINSYSIANNHDFIIYHYPNGINKTPVQVYSMYEPASRKIKVLSNTTGTHLTASDFSMSAHPNYKYTVGITWDDKGHESNRPKNVTGSWAANDKSDQFSIVTDSTKYTQLGFVEVNGKLSDVKFTIDDIEGYTISDQSTSTYTKKFTLKYTGTTSEPGNGSGTGNGGNNPTQPENENFVEDIPSNVTVNYGKDTKKIMATLEDGRTVPLVSDNTKTTILVKRSDQNVYQKPSGLKSDKFIFFDISINIEEGGQIYEVKSVDSPIGVAVEIPVDCDTSNPIKVYHYVDGIMMEPEEVRNASITGTHIVIPTSSYSYYGIAYNTADTEKRTITIDWDDVGYETDRPTSVVADWTATYANDTTLKGTVVFNRDTTVSTQTQTFDVAKKNNNSALVSVVSNVRAITGYKVQPKAGDALGWTIKWDGLTAEVITHTFKFDFSDAPADKRPTEYTFTVVGNYTDGHKETKEFTVPIGTNGTGTQKVTFDLERKDAPDSKHEFTTWDYPEVEGFSLNSSGLTAVFKYNANGGVNANQTVYPITVVFNGDTGNTEKRPTQVEITWTSVTKTTMTTTTGNAVIQLANGVSNVTQNVTIPNTTNEERTVTIVGPVIPGYNMLVNGHTITYNYIQAAKPVQTTETFTVTFEDDTNKAGRRPAEIKITLADTTEGANTVTTTVKIPDNVTTKTPTYTGTIQIPEGKTYAITKVEGLPTGYEAKLEGLKATLKYTPETIDKTFKVVWEGDVEETRPTSIQLPIKVGEETLQTLILSKDTNWSANAKLPKYLRGVEVAYQLTAPSITNYAGTVNGDTITMKYTGTLTDKQKEAIEENAAKDEEAKKEQEALYDYESFDWIDYANRYPDLKKAFGYNKEALYAHYIKYGISEGRVATWTSKYANVNNDILAAYFPNDYKFKVKDETAIDQMVDQMNKDTVTEEVKKENEEGTVTVDKDGNTVITKENEDGTVTETIIDKDGNVVQTKTYATGDNRLTATSWVYIAIIITALGLVAIYYSEFRKCNKAKRVINDFIES